MNNYLFYCHCFQIFYYFMFPEKSLLIGQNFGQGYKQAGGMPFDVFKKLFDTTVFSVTCISYGAAIWGIKEYSVISTVQHKACRFFLRVGKCTPNAAVNGNMG